MSERLEVGYIIIDPDPETEEYTETITITKGEHNGKENDPGREEGYGECHN